MDFMDLSQLSLEQFLLLWAALNKRKNQNQISVVYLGDGALEEGVVHESLNLSKILSVPVLFVVENNLFSSHMHLSLRQPEISACRFAEANNIPNILVDGNNFIEVHEAAKKLIEKSRKNGTPCFMEAITSDIMDMLIGEKI